MRSTKWRRAGVPGELLGEDFAGGVCVDLGMDAQAGADVAGIWEGAQDDVKTVGSFLNGCFGEARDLEEATRNCGVTDCVEGGRGFGKRGSLARRFAAIGVRFHGRQGVAVKNEAQNEIKNYGGEREGRAHFASWAF